jgi:Leucine Rich repeat
VPRALGCLTNLRELDLADNWLGEGTLDDAFPADLASLTRLTRLDLSGNALNGHLPQVLRFMTSLRSLNLARVRASCLPLDGPASSRTCDSEHGSTVGVGVSCELACCWVFQKHLCLRSGVVFGVVFVGWKGGGGDYVSLVPL